MSRDFKTESEIIGEAEQYIEEQYLYNPIVRNFFMLAKVTGLKDSERNILMCEHLLKENKRMMDVILKTTVNLPK